jgi:hypothetical protein
MSNHHSVLDVQHLKQLEQVISVGVHVVATPSLIRASAVTTSVVGNATIALVGQEEHLVLPVVTVEGPSMGEDDGGTIRRAPYLVVHLDIIFTFEEGHSEYIFELTKSCSAGLVLVIDGFLMLALFLRFLASYLYSSLLFYGLHHHLNYRMLALSS